MQNFVVMLCGPHEHDHEVSPQFHRIELALHVARRDQSELLICGDARNGLDVALFVEHVGRAGYVATPVFNEVGSTITDVRAALAYIGCHTPRISSGTVRVVTDDWHMERALTMVRGEASQYLDDGQGYVFRPITAVGGVPPARWQLEREAQGIQDYRSGRYAPNKSLSWGKPH